MRYPAANQETERFFVVRQKSGRLLRMTVGGRGRRNDGRWEKIQSDGRWCWLFREGGGQISSMNTTLQYGRGRMLFRQGGGPVEDDCDGGGSGLLGEGVDEEALAVGGDVVRVTLPD